MVDRRRFRSSAMMVLLLLAGAAREIRAGIALGQNPAGPTEPGRAPLDDGPPLLASLAWSGRWDPPGFRASLDPLDADTGPPEPSVAAARPGRRPTVPARSPLLSGRAILATSEDLLGPSYALMTAEILRPEVIASEMALSRMITSEMVLTRMVTSAVEGPAGPDGSSSAGGAAVGGLDGDHVNLTHYESYYYNNNFLYINFVKSLGFFHANRAIRLITNVALVVVFLCTCGGIRTTDRAE